MERNVATENIMSSLLTTDEFDKLESRFIEGYVAAQKEWSEPIFKCKVCSGGMCRQNNIVYTSNPPKYMYKCDKCGHIEYRAI